MDVLNSDEIQKGIKHIKKKGRTKESKKYFTAFEAFNNIKNIDKARRYRFCAKQGYSAKLLKWSGALIGLLGFVLYMFMEEFSMLLHGWPIILGIAIQVYIFSLESIWATLTINNKVIHPILTMNKEEYENRKKKSLKDTVGEKSKESTPKHQTEQNSEDVNNEK